MLKILLLIVLMTGCATKDGETRIITFYESEYCTLGMSHTYGERFKGKNTCLKNFRIHINDEFVMGGNLDPTIEFRVPLDPDFGISRKK